MSKIFRKLTAIAMAGVMAVSMAVTANAAGCDHLVKSKTNKRLYDHYTNTHFFDLYNSKGQVVGTEKCIISFQTYAYTVVCNNCKAEVDVYYDHQKSHTNPNCPGD